MFFHDLEALRARAAASEGRYLEFLRSGHLSAGLYRLAAGTHDPQQPHREDEVYYVVRGKARFQVGDEDGPVGPGSFLFVPARMPHRFHAITEDLEVLVVFAPPES